MPELTTIADLSPAAYNPRKISPEAKALLERSLKTFGDLSGITINRRTGNLVCGHQRTSVLKNLPNQPIQWGEPFETVLDGSKSVERLGIVEVEGKRFTVREVDWSLSREKAANVIANDLRAQGEFDTELLPLVLAEIEDEDKDVFEAMSFDELVGETADQTIDGVSKGSLAEQFSAPPFTVLDTRAGWWQERKRRWIDLGLRSEEGRGDSSTDEGGEPE